MFSHINSLFAILAVCTLSVTAATDDIESKLLDLADKLVTAAHFDSKITLAVVPFDNQISGNPKAGISVAEFLVTALKAQPTIDLIDRMQLNKAMQEIALSQSGVIDEDKAVSLGKMVAARYLLTGTVTDALGKVMINARIIETETGKIIATATTNLGAAMLSDFAREILGEKSQVSAVLFRSALIPGWGQLYANHPLEGAISLGAFAIGLGGTGYSIAGMVSANDKYNAFISQRNTNSFEQQLVEEWFGTGPTKDSLNTAQLLLFNQLVKEREQSLWKKYTDQQNATIMWGVIAGSVWALNLIDAGIVGFQTKQKVQLYFSAGPNLTTNITLAVRF